MVEDHSRPGEPPAPVPEQLEVRLRTALRESRLELDATRAQLHTCQQDLERARRQLMDLEELIRDLPKIFESKFHQRLQPLLDQQQLLAQDNHALREQARRLLPSATQPGGFAPLRAFSRRWLSRQTPP
ncbi:MAG: hypothetical protein NTW83_04700 [Cyanobacteria bacterium]|nr:hypothetical protein [Cyanobacteriota bacterium]